MGVDQKWVLRCDVMGNVGSDWDGLFLDVLNVGTDGDAILVSL